ncbi:MAG: PQQ-binding-like beta-propeller repeat protein [Gemmobacter sp.]
MAIRSQSLGALAPALVVLSLVAACEREVILSGQRFEVRTPLDASAAAEAGTNVILPEAQPNRAVPFAAGAPVVNADWTHRAGTPAHAMPHAALSPAPQRIWSVSIGAGDSRRHRITTAPVVGGGRVFAMDSASRVTAVSPEGGVLWTFDAVPPGEASGSASGGGLAYGEGRLFVTTGYGELIALDPASGTPVWRQRFEAPVTAAPTVAGGTVFVSSRDSAGWAVSAADGRQRWVISAVPSTSGVAGPASPAVDGGTVVFPFGSGEIIAATRDRGVTQWNAPVAGQRAGRAIGYVTDITGDPVIRDGTVYVGSNGGRTAALDLATGARRWDVGEGAQGPVWVGGGAVFLVNDENRLVRLDSRTGERIWATDLPFFRRDNVRRQRHIVPHYGPVLAGGRLVVVSSEGAMTLFDPVDGSETARLALPASAAAPPAVAGGALYVVTTNGQLHAFR